MSLSDAVRSLKAERKTLMAEVGRIDRAIALLDPTEKAEAPKPKAKPKRKEWTGPAEAVTCPICGFVAGAPQGLSAHVRIKHDDDDDSTDL